ncbi:hypothetical protein HCH_06287 [Hahella chejuensis KCTC 2396]|uniref:DUF1565 domain-containing protein n=1 Tax=Hahella chejuensis (strain KCTC 2396) TaxID=349521 RepID=Q2S8T8_HAHCH|nr:hypothetical protein [Hahella chejuensis]ABC32936.1 hypothetical protein HCH_06287 [Hahella chejuensis KCTC 2396]
MSAPTGDDANDGHLTSEGGTGPWKTLQKAAATAVAGETVYVRAGEYKEPGPIPDSDKLWGVRVLNDGEEGSPIGDLAFGLRRGSDLQTSLSSRLPVSDSRW